MTLAHRPRRKAPAAPATGPAPRSSASASTRASRYMSLLPTWLRSGAVGVRAALPPDLTGCRIQHVGCRVTLIASGLHLKSPRLGACVLHRAKRGDERHPREYANR